MGCKLTKLSARQKSVLMTLAYAFVFLLLIRPASIDFVAPHFVLTAYARCFYAVGAIVLVLYLRFIRIDVAGALIVAICGLTLFATVGNDGDFGLWWRRWPVCAVAVMATSLGCRRHFRELIAGVFAATFILSAVNAASMLMFPDGLYASSLTGQADNFFLGHRNNAYQVVIPSICCGFLLGELYAKKAGLLGFLALAAAIVQSVCAFSATTALSMGVVVIFLILVRFERLRPLCNYVTFVAGYAISFVGIVLLRLQGFAAPFIEGVLHKSTTFTGRTYAWDRAIYLLEEDKLLSGYGMSAYRQLGANGMSYAHAHNELLNLALIGGLPATIALCGFVAYPAWRLRKHFDSTIVAIIALMVGGFLTVALVEVVDCASFFFALALGCSVRFPMASSRGECEE